MCFFCVCSYFALENHPFREMAISLSQRFDAAVGKITVLEGKFNNFAESLIMSV